MFDFRNDNKIIIIIFFGFLISCIYGFKYIKKYDVNKIKNGSVYNSYFFGKEGGTPSYWEEAHNLKKEIEEKGFFESGNKYEFKYLPSKIVYIYYNIINDDIKVFDNKLDQFVFKTNNNKFGLIVIQNLLYSFSLLFFFFSFKNLFKNNNLLIISILLFLCFEPTLNQWNRVIFSESIFFSLQLLTISILINYNYNTSYKKIIFLGILLSLMYLQRTVSIYYFLIIFLYFYIFFRKKLLINLTIITLIYISTHLFIGYHNFKRDGKLYFLPILAKEDLYGYFIPKITKYNKDPEFEKKFITRHDKLDNFTKLNNLDSEKDINIKDRIEIADENFSESLNLIISYPIYSIKEYMISFSHYILLKPNEIYFLLENYNKYNGQFFLSKDFKSELPYKIVYSVFIYLMSLMGILYFIKKKDFKTLYLLFGSILYFALPVVWHKQSSYLAPILIYISVFFGAGIFKINSFIKFIKE